jgi:hypothetical protein
MAVPSCVEAPLVHRKRDCDGDATKIGDTAPWER